MHDPIGDALSLSIPAPPPPGLPSLATMRLAVKSLDGKQFAVDVELSTMVEELKAMIAKVRTSRPCRGCRGPPPPMTELDGTPGSRARPSPPCYRAGPSTRALNHTQAPFDTAARSISLSPPPPPRAPPPTPPPRAPTPPIITPPHNKEEMVVDWQKLVYQGKILADGKPLSAYGVAENSFVVRVTRAVHANAAACAVARTDTNANANANARRCQCTPPPPPWSAAAMARRRHSPPPPKLPPRPLPWPPPPPPPP